MEEPPPPVLYHYTTTEVLLKIFGGRSIWMTDIQFMNDRREFHIPQQQVTHAIERIDFDELRAGIEKIVSERRLFLPEEPLPGQRDHLSAILHVFDTLKKRIVNEAAGHVQGRINNFYLGKKPYIFSLSSDGDSLSQWRAYGRGELCIGLRTDKLKELTGLQPIKVEYYKKEERNVFDDFFRSYFGMIYGALRRDGYLSPDATDEWFYRVGDICLREAHNVARLKSASFKDEKEWRLIEGNFSMGLPRPIRKPPLEVLLLADRYLRPRLVLPLGSHEDVKSLVKTICFGPGSDTELVDCSVRALNERWGTEFKPLISEAPFRY